MPDLSATGVVAQSYASPSFFLPASPATVSLPEWQQDLLSPQCATSSVEMVLNRCVIASTEQMKKEAIALIVKTMGSGPGVSNYMSFVLAYLEDFKISIEPLPDSPVPLKKVPNLAIYSTITRTLTLKRTSDLKDPSLIWILRSQFRYAYWQAINQYTLFPKSSISISNIYPSTDETKQAYLENIEKGNQRIADLKEMLTSEINRTLKPKDKDYLEKLRKLCRSINYDLYKFTMPHVTEGKLPVAGRNYDVRIADVHTQVKFLSIHKDSFGFYRSQLYFHDPVIYILAIADQISRSVKSSIDTAEEYCRQFDAEINAFFPEQLREWFFPEIENYNKNLQRMSMRLPSPRAMSYPLSSLFTQREVDLMILDHASSNEAYFLSLFTSKDKRGSFIVTINAALLDCRKKMQQGLLMGADVLPRLQQMKSMLNLHVKNRILAYEAHRLLGRLFYLEGASPDKVCENYKKALHNSVKFDSFDYIDYIDSLLNAGQAANADVVRRAAVKAFPEFEESFDFERIKDRIKDVRSPNRPHRSAW